MEYITVAEAAAAWQLSEQMIRKQCREGIIPGAYREGRSWLIPDYAQKHIPDTDREKKETPHLARKLQKQKTKKSFHGLYDYIQIYFTYCSSRMASNRLSQKQIEMIYKKGKVQDFFEPVKVSDLVETLNHHLHRLYHRPYRNCKYHNQNQSYYTTKDFFHNFHSFVSEHLSSNFRFF